MEEVIALVVGELRASLAQEQHYVRGESESERVLVRLLHNVATNPQSERFRKVPKDKPVMARVLGNAAVVAVLHAVGLSKSE